MKPFHNLYLPLGWTIFIQVLLLLPGSVLPGEGSFSIPQLDKIIHIIFFGVFVASWSLYYSRKARTHEKLKWGLFFIFLIAAANGILIEYIQLYFIPNRDFDKGDIIADLLSASVSYGICNVKLLTYEEKVPRGNSKNSVLNDPEMGLKK